MENNAALAALAALSQETRLDIFRLLVAAGDGGLPAGEIAARLGVQAPTLSFHLAHLKQAQLVTRRRDSRLRIYAANYPVMSELVAFLTENCCRGIPGSSATGAQCSPAAAACVPALAGPSHARSRSPARVPARTARSLVRS
jgi:DNA-binding transcriptional ArsR family regulator